MLQLKRSALIALMAIWSLCGSPCNADEQFRAVNTQHFWTLPIEEPDSNATLLAVASSPSDGSVSLLIEKSGSSSDKQSRFVLYTVNARGGVDSRVDLTEKMSEGQLALTGGPITVTADGTRLVLLSAQQSDKRFIITIRDGVIRENLAITLKHRSFKAGAIIARSDSTVILLGTEAGNGRALFVERDGSIKWDIVIDKNRHEELIDGFSAADGTTIVTGQSGQISQFTREDALVLLLKIDKDGHILKQYEVKGRSPSISAMPDRTLVIVYDTANGSRQEIVARVLTESFEEKTEQRIVTNEMGLLPPRVLTRGSYTVVSLIRGISPQSYILRGGKLLDSVNVGSAPSSQFYGVADTNIFIGIRETVMVTKTRQSRRVIELIGYRLRIQ